MDSGWMGINGGPAAVCDIRPDGCVVAQLCFNFASWSGSRGVTYFLPADGELACQGIQHSSYSGKTSSNPLTTIYDDDM